MSVVVDNRSGEELPLAAIEELASFVMEREQNIDLIELSLSFVDAEEMAELNATYRGKDGPTDVLSFECDNPDEAPEDEDEPQLLGDVIICPAVARRHAQRDELTMEEELWILVIHGILHLFGFNHEEEEQANLMESREDALIEDWALLKGRDLSWH